jgi:hypothetical protein
LGELGEGILCLGSIVMMHPTSDRPCFMTSPGLAILVPHQIICMRECRLFQLLIPLAIVTYIPYEILVSNLYFSILYTYTSTSRFFISERELVVISMVYPKHCNSRTAACVRNSMKFEINVFNNMEICNSTRGKKLIRTSK